MVRRRLSLALAGSMLLAGLAWSSASVSAKPVPPDPFEGGGLAVYSGTIDQAGLEQLLELGVDRQELQVAPVGGAVDQFTVEVILSDGQAEALNAAGASLATKASAQRQITALADGVFRRYSGPGGIQEELVAQAAAYPAIAQLQVIGQTVNGQDINAVRVTQNPSRARPGRRPTTVYVGAQHAREWITPEMVRRLLDYYLSGYGTDPQITNIINTTELWFIPVANPDGYDFSHDSTRLWRKNLRDNNLDGVIAPGDGVDLNRNYPTRWGYDNEGSSPNPGSETYRGPEPASEPETQALDGLFARLTPQFLVNYHSAAELLLYGLGWQVATPSPDDVLYEAMAGNDVIGSAIPGYDPDISAELYTTNGDTDSHMQEAYGALGFTPEMGTCESASDAVDDDEWLAEDCDSGFNFPDDEGLIQAEFEKNIPFALAVAESAPDPDDPVSVVGIDTPNFVLDSFDVSYGDPQTVAVTAKRDLVAPIMQYRINGGRVRRAIVREWDGGERYGFENIDYYRELRGEIRGTAPGDEVEVWFTGVARDPDELGRIESEHFTYSVQSDTGSPVLIVANEDYTGYNPEDTPSGAPKYIDEHVAALQANGIEPDVWDVDAQGVPHDLGVLSHYAAVVWYLGDNRLTQDEEDVITETPYYQAPFNLLPDTSVAERQQYLTIAVRDYLNGGGKLIHAGETTGYTGLLDELLGGALGGIYYGLDDAPEEQCVVDTDPYSNCLLLADDFFQYYLGAWDRQAIESAEGVVGTAGPTAGDEALFGGPATEDNPIDEPGTFSLTSDLLPAADYPQFAGEVVLEYLGAAGSIEAVEGEFAVAANHVDEAYMRLGRTFDLTGVTAADAPTFEAQLAWSVEPGYDHLIVEAHTVGQENWTTLPDLNGNTSSVVPIDCEVGYYLGLHPNLLKYLTPGNPCTTPGSATPGLWNSFTGESGGWEPVAFDLSAYAGQQVELIVSYVTDPAFGGSGAIIDDTRLTTTGGVVEAQGFEEGLGTWQVLGPPEGSPTSPLDWERAGQLGTFNAGVATEDTLLLGFGLEQLESAEARAELVADALELLAG